MWVPRARDDDGKTPFMDKYWLIPNEEQPGAVDELRSRPAVELCKKFGRHRIDEYTPLSPRPRLSADLMGDRSKCRQYSQATYEKLLALCSGVTGVRDVTVASKRGDSPGLSGLNVYERNHHFQHFLLSLQC